jgi:NAD(P)-dependent dehydrogenase (short-subunit alcohol dehydrogenase family)
LTVASVCGIYAVPTLPIYTSAKHGVLGFVRSYGKYLGDEEGIALNAVCPNVVRTHISSEEFYGVLEERALLTPMESVLGVFEGWLWGDDERASGQCVEVGPRGKRVLGPEAWAFMDRESEELCGDRGLLYQRSRRLQTGGQ